MGYSHSIVNETGKPLSYIALLSVHIIFTVGFTVRSGNRSNRSVAADRPLKP